MPTYEQWVAEVEKALKGAPFDKRMYTRRTKGLPCGPSTRQDWPAEGDRRAFRRRCPLREADARRAIVSPTGTCGRAAYPDPAQANDIILAGSIAASPQCTSLGPAAASTPTSGSR